MGRPIMMNRDLRCDICLKLYSFGCIMYVEDLHNQERILKRGYCTNCEKAINDAKKQFEYLKNLYLEKKV